MRSLLAVVLLTIIAGPAAAQERSLGSPEAVDGAIERLQVTDRALYERLLAVERRVEQHARIGTEYVGCVSEALVLAGLDLVSTAWALDRCEACGEANPIGINDEARLGLKVAQMGGVVGRCFSAAKTKYQGGEPRLMGLVKWINRLVTGFAILNNSLNAIRQKPLISWGNAQR